MAPDTHSCTNKQIGNWRRVKRWRAKNRKKYNEYQKELMRKRRHEC